MRERTKKGKGQGAGLAGSLLLAHPALNDPNFRRTVILMSTHDSDGAMGVVLNRPLGRRLGELNGDFSLGPLASVPVFRGGPVQTEQMMLAAWQPQGDAFRLHFGLERRSKVDLIEVRWPSGTIDKVSAVGANKILTIREGKGVVDQKDLSKRP